MVNLSLSEGVVVPDYSCAGEWVNVSILTDCSPCTQFAWALSGWIWPLHSQNCSNALGYYV